MKRLGGAEHEEDPQRMIERDESRPKTLGDAISGMSLATAAAVGALVLVVVGSLGPWATAPLASASGIDGDGKVTLGLAALGLLLLSSGRLAFMLGLVGAAILALGVYDAFHIHHVISHALLFGRQVDHVGWGVYAVAAGGLAVTLLTARDLLAS